MVGHVAPSGNGVGFWDRPEEALDRASAIGCNSFRLSIEWSRVFPSRDGPDRAALARYVEIVEACVARGLEPLVTLYHFAHPAWLGEDFWLRPDAPQWFRRWAEVVADTLSGSVRHWVTINEINVLALNSWLLGRFPPGRSLALEDASIAVDHLLAAHVAGYEALHAARKDAVVTTNNAALNVYEYDRMLIDVLLARSAEVDRADLDDWIADRRWSHDRALPPSGPVERVVRRASAGVTFGTARRRPLALRGLRDRRSSLTRRAVDAIYESPHERTLDALGVDYYDPDVVRRLRLAGHRAAGGRSGITGRRPWDLVPDPSALTRRLTASHRMAPDLPIWVVENGLSNRVTNGRRLIRTDGWDRQRFLRESLAALVAAVDAGVPVAGYWHRSLVDSYEWGSYEPRFGLYGMDRDRGAHGTQWLETDSMGDDAAGTYRGLIDGLRSGDGSVLGSG
jgi:beta-glucosidase/6-phospho-beta-glucosidase/beta-galactosidase